VLEQMYGSSNSKRPSSSTPENISSSSSSTLCDQEQEEQSSVQKEELNSASLKKPDGPVSQTEGSGFGRTKIYYLKKMIALHQVPTSMMTQMMSMMNMISWWNLGNSYTSI
jgi:hypothetical protein